MTDADRDMLHKTYNLVRELMRGTLERDAIATWRPSKKWVDEQVEAIEAEEPAQTEDES